MIRHARVDLALHSLRSASGPSLLLLHGLGGSSPYALPAELAGWPGAVYGLDFSGHGRSSVPAGAGYTCEILMGDADTALRELGPCTVLGRGLGGYIALLIAGARPELTRGAIIADGNGLAGGGIRPGSGHIDYPYPSTAATTPDPFALLELSCDVRPRDYAVSFVQMAVHLSPLDAPITVSALIRPPWLQAVVESYGVRVADISHALSSYAR